MFSTRWFSLTGPILGLFLSAGLSVSARAQSVADAARVQRQKHAISELDAKKLFQAEADKPASNRTLRRGVITNDDLPADPDTSSSSTPAGGGSRSPTADFTMQQPSEAAAAHWKQQISAQKTAIASLQEQIDKLSSSVHFVEANRYSNGVQYNQRQLQKQHQVEQMRHQLEEQKQILEQMQETARGQGFGSAVYDP